jgi:O-Antigen ligase
VLALLGAHPDALVALTLGGALIALAFVASGGVALGPNTWTEIVIVLVGAILAAVTVVLAPPGRRLWGGVTLTLLAALAALTATSIAWSVQPDDSWIEANRTLAYLAAFTGGVALVKLAPQRWRGVLAAVALASVVLSGYAILTKVFPSLSPSDPYARLRAPFDYWNGVGLMAALGIPATLWLGARRDGHAALRPLALPLLGLLLLALLLSEGRGALLATVIGLAFWFSAVPLRLRGAAVLAASTLGALAVALWDFGNSGLSKDGATLALRASAGHQLGVFVAAMAIVLLATGFALEFGLDRWSLSPRGRRRTGAAMIGLLALVPVVALLALASKPGGVSGQISHDWHTLTDPSARTPGNDPGRLTAVGSVRARYWDEALKVWREARWEGVGAGGFATARGRFRTDPLIVRHAHGYVVQTLADLGLLGLAVNLALLVAWAIAAARATGSWPRRLTGAGPRAPNTPERTALLTLTATVIVFGVHSAADWTWFVPATTVLTLVCAGWLAGRGPLAEARPPLRSWRSLRTPPPLALVIAIAILAAGVLAGWAIWQPLRSSQVSDQVGVALDAGQLAAAHADAERSHRIDPLSVEPYFDLAGVDDQAGHADAAQRVLEEAVQLQPANPDTWTALGRHDLVIQRPRDALSVLGAALYLNPASSETQDLYDEAKTALAASGG